MGKLIEPAVETGNGSSQPLPQRLRARVRPDSEHPEITAMLNRFQEEAFLCDTEAHTLDRPIYGTTVYVATFDVPMRRGTFTGHVFQDLIHKGYILALCFGDVCSARQLHTRLHSSCVTSETLRGCDCDCVQQLEGAIDRIIDKGQGILFYLMQEGRGVGYVSKARDRMLVQATNDSISTFQAYHMIGLERDYRDYRNIADICAILSIQAGFIVFTNNPDKVEGLRAQGLNVIDTETIEYDPGPFNLAYLTSKAEAGHILEKPARSVAERIIPPEPVVPFKPHALPESQRFVYAASYFLPIKPVDGEIVLLEPEFKELFADEPIDALIETEDPLVTGYRMLRNNRFLIEIDEGRLYRHRENSPDDKICRLLTTPYWFRVHVYFDIVTGQDWVVLTYGQSQIYDRPIVRLHSESLFNRFPVKDMDNRDKYKASLRKIVRYGTGMIVLMYNDGRGAGFGAFAVDRMLRERQEAHSTDESYRRLGVGYDSRDYDAAMQLVKHHLPHPHIQMVMNSPGSLIKKTEYAEALARHGLEVEKWIFLDKEKS